jgi:hypothetical protein
MVTPTASAAITTINRCGATIEQAPKPESKIQRFAACPMLQPQRKYSCKPQLNQLKSPAEPAATLNGHYVAYAPVS